MTKKKKIIIFGTIFLILLFLFVFLFFYSKKVPIDNEGYTLINSLEAEVYEKYHILDFIEEKNLKVEDIQDKMNLTVWNYNNYEGYGRTYNPTNKEYPIILSESSGQIVNGREGSLGISEQNTLILGTAIASSWTVKQTLWTAELNVNNYIDPMYHQLFHARITKPCWLSSRSERPWGNDWYYDTFLITPTQIAMGGHMAYSNAS